jgi:hypothetical protein
MGIIMLNVWSRFVFAALFLLLGTRWVEAEWDGRPMPDVVELLFQSDVVVVAHLDPSVRKNPLGERRFIIDEVLLGEDALTGRRCRVGGLHYAWVNFGWPNKRFPEPALGRFGPPPPQKPLTVDRALLFLRSTGPKSNVPFVAVRAGIRVLNKEGEVLKPCLYQTDFSRAFNAVEGLHWDEVVGQVRSLAQEMNRFWQPIFWSKADYVWVEAILDPEEYESGLRLLESK